MPNSSIKTSTRGLQAALLLLLIIIVSSIATLHTSSVAAKAVRDTADVIFLLEDVQDDLQNAETGQRGYLLTDEKVYLDPYNNATKTINERMANVRLKFVSGTRTERDRVQQLETAVAVKLAEIQKTIELRQQNRKADALWLVNKGLGREQMLKIHEAIDALHASTLDRRNQAIAHAENVRKWAFGVDTAGSALLFLIVGASTGLIRRGINQQEQISEERRISEENLAVTLSSIGDGLIVTDRSNKITMINAVTERLTGWTSKEAQGKPITGVFRIVNQSTRQTVVNPAEEAIRENRIVEMANHTVLIAKDKSEIFVDDSAAPIRDKEGNVRGAILVFRDVTMKKQAQQVQEALNIRLRRAMAETHHRVKNNLQVIAALVELQLVEGEAMVPAEALIRVKQHVIALATIHDLLTHEAKEKGDVEYLQTRDVLEKLRPLLSNLVGNRTLTFAIADMRLPIRQGTSLAVLVNELVSNAVKHGTGEIVITLTQLDAQQGRLSVRDHGNGFPENFNARRAANTGLELIDSLGRWDLHGQVVYGNHPEGGADVSVTFPLDMPVAKSDHLNES